MSSPVLAIKINNRPYSYSSALTIFQACLEKKIFVPRFCYHVALKISGNCRMCLLEEKSSLKPVASCAVTIGAGMTVYTQTELVKKAREGVLEYLLANHPLDCPICDQGGECDLQDQTMVFGADRGRFYELKRSTPNKNLGFLIKTFLNRCIHCARRTRFMTDVAGVETLSLLGRGYKTEISGYTFDFLQSEISGNIIDLCPVGALTSKPYAFKARPWELVSVYSFDILEPFGANLDLNYRGLELMRILPRINYDINDEWISDKTRFYYDAFNLQRLIEPYFLRQEVYEQVSWANALKIWKNLFLQCLKVNLCYQNRNLLQNFVAGEFADLESQMAGSFFTKKCSAVYKLLNFKDSREEYLGTCSTRKFLFGKNLLLPKIVILIDVNPRFESPILNLKLRKIALEDEVKIILLGFCSNINFFFIHLDYKTKNLKHILNFFNSSKEEMLLITSVKTEIVNQANFPVYKIATAVGLISHLENFPYKIAAAEESSFLEVFVGQITRGSWACTSSFSINMLHHMDSDFWSTMQKYIKGLLLPTKFYLEKFASYVSESGFFFSTLTNIFGYSIRGTKEDWKIVLAIMEFMGEKVNLLQKNITKVSTQQFGRFDNYGLPLDRGLMVEITNGVHFSRVNEYYKKTILDRISPVLSLCAKNYLIINDYKYLL